MIVTVETLHRNVSTSRTDDTIVTDGIKSRILNTLGALIYVAYIEYVAYTDVAVQRLYSTDGQYKIAYIHKRHVYLIRIKAISGNTEMAFYIYATEDYFNNKIPYCWRGVQLSYITQ